MATSDLIPSDLALELECDPPSDKFLGAVKHFFGYLDEVACAVTPDGNPVRWTVKVREGSTVLAAMAPADLASGTWAAICKGASAAIEAVAAGHIDDAGISENGIAHLKDLSALTDGPENQRVPLRLWINRHPKAIGPELARAIQKDWRTAYRDYGSVEGWLEGIRGLSGLKIRVKDTVSGRVIECRMEDDLLDQALANFRNRVEVSGLIYYRGNGEPIRIEAEGIDALPDDSDLPTAADVRGILARYA